MTPPTLVTAAPLGPSHLRETVGFPGSPAAIVAVQLRVYVPPAVELPEVWMVTAGGGSVRTWEEIETTTNSKR